MIQQGQEKLFGDFLNKASDEWIEKNYVKYYKSLPVDSTIREMMDDLNITNVNLVNTIDRQNFSNALEKAIESNPFESSVDFRTAEELQNFKLFLSSDNMAGIAIKPDGDITAVFKNSNSLTKGAINDLLITARANGGIKMDCYGKSLVNMYEKCGYVPVARIPFNADYVSDSALLADRPDVYVLMKNRDTIKEVIYNNTNRKYTVSLQEDLDNLPTFEDYDEALEYRDKLLKTQGD